MIYRITSSNVSEFIAHKFILKKVRVVGKGDRGVGTYLTYIKIQLLTSKIMDKVHFSYEPWFAT